MVEDAVDIEGPEHNGKRRVQPQMHLMISVGGHASNDVWERNFHGGYNLYGV